MHGPRPDRKRRVKALGKKDDNQHMLINDGGNIGSVFRFKEDMTANNIDIKVMRLLVMSAC